MNKRNIFKVLATTVAVLGIGAGFAFVASNKSLVKADYNINTPALASGTDEIVGVLITADTGESNKEQEKIEKEGKVYAKYNEQDDVYEFDGIKGANCVHQTIMSEVNGVEEELDTFSSVGIEYLDNPIYEERIEGDPNSLRCSLLTGNIIVNAGLGKDIICYVNPVYKEVSTGKIYVTANKSKKITCPIKEYQKNADANGVLVGSVDIKTEEYNVSKEKEPMYLCHLNIKMGLPYDRVEGTVYDKNGKSLEDYNLKIQDVVDGTSILTYGAYSVKERVIYSDKVIREYDVKPVVEEKTYYFINDYAGEAFVDNFTRNVISPESLEEE